MLSNAPDKLRPAYERETDPLVRQRLVVFCGVFVVFMGLGTLVEVQGFPERRPWSWIAYLVECAVCIGATVQAHRGPPYASTRRIGSVMIAVMIWAITGYHMYVHAPAQRVVMTLGTAIGGVAVTIPWGLWPQLAAGLTAVVAVTTGVLTGFLPLEHEAVAMPTTAMLASALISTLGAYFLDRYRLEAFRRTMMQAEEAEIAAGLLAVTQALSAHLQSADMLDQVTQHTVKAVGCDSSGVLLLNPERHVYYLAAGTNVPPDALEILTHLDIAPDLLPVFSHFRPGTITVIEDWRTQDLVPAHLLESLHTQSVMFAPICREQQIVGVLVAGYNTRVGPFSDKAKRLTVGIAQAAAVAIENGRLVNELRGANRLKSEFVATMSHELRTPLNVIGGYAEMLADRVFDAGSTGWNDAITRIQRSTVELNDLVSATLDVNRLEAGREPVDRQTVDLGEMLARLDSDVEPLVHPGVSLRWAVTIDVGQVVTDRVKLKTILKNLVVNALKFTPAGNVDVDVGSDEGALLIAVRDSGIGIAPEHLSMVFEMFRQVDGSSTRRFGGVGLGLHIVRRLVAMLGGTISVDSTLGAGSTFTVRLPGAISVAGPIVVAN